MTKTGADHLASPRDGRAVYLDGRRIDEPADRPALRNAVRSAAALYHFRSAPDKLERKTYVAPGSDASFVTKGHALRTFDWNRATGLVKDLLARYDLPE